MTHHTTTDAPCYCNACISGPHFDTALAAFDARHWTRVGTTAPGNCPYTVGRRACIAGVKGHAGPHDWPKVR